MKMNWILSWGNVNLKAVNWTHFLISWSNRLLQSCATSSMHHFLRDSSRNLNWGCQVLLERYRRVVANQVVDLFGQNNLQDPFQSAFWYGHSIETAHVHVHNGICRALEDLLVMLDLSAAFDTINHHLMLATVKSRVSWTGQSMAGELSHWQQVLNIRGTHTKSKGLSCGVPQGSGLGLILFSTCTSPLGRLLDERGVSYHPYADDTNLSASLNCLDSAVSLMENCIHLVHSWIWAIITGKWMSRRQNFS